MKKSSYTKEEIDELKAWFDAHDDIIPESMYIEESTYSPNLRDTLLTLFEQSYIYSTNPRMQGCVVLLLKIKKKLEEKML